MTSGTNASARRWAWLLGTLAIGLLLAAILLAFVDRDAPPTPNLPSWNLPDVLDMIGGIPVPALGILLAVRRPENRMGWLFIVAGLGLALNAFAGTWAVHALLAHPGLPGGRLFGWLANWTWPIAVCALPLLLLWFPTGRVKSPRWRVVAWLDVAIAVAFAVGTLIVATASWENPFSDDLSGSPIANAIVDGIFVVGAPLFAGVVIASFVSAALRFRASTGDERLQLKWFASAAALVAVTFTLGFLFDNPVISVLGTLALQALYVAIAIAILKYRLYDIDVVIGKTVVFATLVAFITVVYVALVVGVGTLVGNEGSPLLSALAAALVARGVQPRAAAGAAAREPRRLREASHAVRGALGVHVARGGHVLDRGRPAAHGPDPRRGDRGERGAGVAPRGLGAAGGGVVADERGSSARLGPADPSCRSFPERERAFPVRHGGELLGAITVVTPAAEPLAADRERLLGDVAAQTALVLRNVRLIEELRESRRRIVAAQDERAKALERNLHDGAQQQLVALAVKQRLAEGLVERDPARAKAMLAEIQADTQDALETLRDLARGVYPPLLADQGLGAALAAQARKAAVPVEVEADGIGRYPQDVEATVYFCCLEALQNVAKYAEASRVTVRLSGGDGGLVFEVRDDGIGFDPASAGRGSGSRAWPTGWTPSAARSRSAARRGQERRSSAASRLDPSVANSASSVRDPASTIKSEQSAAVHHDGQP